MPIEEMYRHFRLTLADAGPNRVQVYSILRKHLQISAVEAKAMMSDRRHELAAGGWWDVRPLADALREAGAGALLRVVGPSVSAEYALHRAATCDVGHQPFRVEGYLVATELLSYLTTEMKAPQGLLVRQPDLWAQIAELLPVRVGGFPGYYGRAVVEGALWTGPYLPLFPGCLKACAVTLLDTPTEVTLEFAA